MYHCRYVYYTQCLKLRPSRLLTMAICLRASVFAFPSAIIILLPELVVFKYKSDVTSCYFNAISL